MHFLFARFRKKPYLCNVNVLERHIEILLLSNDCVIVPGLGGFMAHHVDARYDETDGTFLPPLRTLGFNPRLTMNDSLLVQSYIEAYDISYPEALRRIEAEVAEIRQHLESKREYELNDIGILRLNQEGNLEFEPCEAGILTPYLYGLSSFEMSPLVVETKVPVETPQNEDTAKVPEESAITIKMSWLRNAVAAAAAIIAFFMIGTPISNGDSAMEMQQSAFIAIPQHTIISQQQTADDIQETQTVSKEDAKDSISAEADITTEEISSKSTYCIVLASQVTQKNAEIFIEKLSKEGYSEVRLVTSKSNMLRIVYGNYASETEAANSLRSLRNKSDYFEQSWVLEIKD